MRLVQLQMFHFISKLEKDLEKVDYNKHSRLRSEGLPPLTEVDISLAKRLEEIWKTGIFCETSTSIPQPAKHF